MDDRRTTEGLEHLQAAASELVAAARSFLDVAEDVIADPDRFGGMASGAVEMLKGLTGTGEQPWERHARDDEEPAPEPRPPKKASASRVKRIVVD